MFVVIAQAVIRKRREHTAAIFFIVVHTGSILRTGAFVMEAIPLQGFRVKPQAIFRVEALVPRVFM